MADEVEKCNMNNTLLFQNAFSVNAVKEEGRQENDFIDEKIEISETAVTTEVQDSLLCEEMKQYDMSTISDNIKTELPSSEVQYDIVRAEFKTEKGLSADDIKIEFDHGFLYCEDCQVYCDDYCAKCGMLVHILNRTIPINADSISREELPNDILEIRDYCGEFRIFAVKDIPAGVKFGPFTGLSRTEPPWKIRRGKFVVNKEKLKYLNWMQYVSAATNISEQNLLVLQYKHNLYYQSTRQIHEGDELLVYFGEEYEDSLNRNVEVDFIPATENFFKDSFACTFCCLGFSSKSYLAKHKAICPWNVDRGFSMKELMQCPSCDIVLDRKEYVMHYMAYCCQGNDRKCTVPTPGSITAKVGGHKTRQQRIYKCQQCKYSAKYKVDLKNHTNQHYGVKLYKCGACCRRFKTKEVRRLHVGSTHMCAGEKTTDKASLKRHMTLKRLKRNIKIDHTAARYLKDFNYKCDTCKYRTNSMFQLKRHINTRHPRVFNYKCDTCDYKTSLKSSLDRHIESRHSNKSKYKCDTCDFKTNYKFHLKTHIESKHLKVFKYKCDTCDFKANWRGNLKSHIEAKHTFVFKYKCDKCDYKANRKSRLENHVDVKHLKEFKYKCDGCAYKTNNKSNLKNHVKSRHLKQYNYMCGLCDYKAYFKSQLKKHIETKHLREFKYKCDTCEYETNSGAHLQTHIEARHLKEFKYKCDGCVYKTNNKSNLKNHVKSRHLKGYNYMCGLCDYKAYLKSELKKHIETKHSSEFKYKCDRCEYKTNSGAHLKTHIEARHLKEFKYKCETCDFETNWKSSLKVHVETKHSTELKYTCDTCEYKTNFKHVIKRHVETRHLKKNN